MTQNLDAKNREPREPANLEALAVAERDALIRLGAATLDIWDQMPRDCQQKLFAAASSQPGERDLEALRRKLALILHSHHQRTGRVAKPEEKHHPPAGPHARPELTNFDATPGSGLLPPRRGRDKEVDPGAG